MEIMDTIRSRKSIRGFKPDIVPREVLESIIKNALWAPSWGNTQPWEIAVLGPEVVKKLTEGFFNVILSGKPPNPDLVIPETWPAINKKRYVEVGRSLFNSMGIRREDKEARNIHYMNMFRFFGAPQAIIVYMDKALSPSYGPFDLGSLTNNICLLAHEVGVGTCILASSAHYPDVVREHLNISEDKIIVVSIAVGYPDKDHPSYQFKSTRDENVISWHGF